MPNYQIEYREKVEQPWYRAGFTLTEAGAIADYKRNFEHYQNNKRRCLKISVTPVTFDVVIRETS